MMTKREFIEELQNALTGSMTSSSVNENIRYYEDYFDMQIRSGKREEIIAQELGDARLLAKTIIEAGKHEGRNASSYEEYEEVYDENGQADYQQQGTAKTYKMPGWLIIMIIVIVLILIIGTVTSLLSALLPILLPILLITMVVRIFKSRG